MNESKVPEEWKDNCVGYDLKRMCIWKGCAFREKDVQEGWKSARVVGRTCSRMMDMNK